MTAYYQIVKYRYAECGTRDRATSVIMNQFHASVEIGCGEGEIQTTFRGRVAMQTQILKIGSLENVCSLE